MYLIKYRIYDKTVLTSTKKRMEGKRREEKGSLKRIRVIGWTTCENIERDSDTLVYVCLRVKYSYMVSKNWWINNYLYIKQKSKKRVISYNVITPQNVKHSV